MSEEEVVELSAILLPVEIFHSIKHRRCSPRPRQSSWDISVVISEPDSVASAQAPNPGWIFAAREILVRLHSAAQLAHTTIPASGAMRRRLAALAQAHSLLPDQECGISPAAPADAEIRIPARL